MDESSKRSTRKRKKNGNDGQALYNDKGLIISSGKDICDCLNENCPGCHFACAKCKSTKCGLECREKRKWTYDEVKSQSINSNKFSYIRKNTFI